MARFTKLIESLSETFRRSGARTLTYFHADHFEPWRAMGGRVDVSEPNGADILEFLRQTETLEFARNLTLFLKPAFRLALAGPGVISAQGDGVGFRPLTDTESVVHDEALRLIGASSHDLQVHIHHEYCTRNDMYSTVSKYNREEPLRRFLAEDTTAELDEGRLRLLLDLTLDAYRKGSGRDFDRWFFVHGMWALNGSDRDVCQVDREIGLLLEKGCRGDFTFPAGRPHTDPVHTAPFFCEPVDAPKSYDLPAAQPRFAYGEKAGGRFFIWSSVIKHQFCSLDYYSKEIRTGLEDIDRLAQELVQTSVFLDGNLYLKTHAHSMNTDYFDSVRRPIYPHFHPGVQALLGVIFDAAADAGLDICFRTASQVYDDFIAASYSGPRDIAGDSHTIRRTQTADAVVNGMTPLERLEAFGGLVAEVSERVVAERIAKLGETLSGAYPYYADLLARKTLVHPYEMEVAAHLARTLPDGAVVHEFGAGFGSQALLLAVAGFQVLGIDADHRRLATAAAIRAALSREVPWVAARLDFKEAAIPQVLAGLDCREATAVATDVTSGMTIDELPALIETVSHRYKAVVFDVERFFTRTKDARDMAAVREMFSRHYRFVEPITDASVGRFFYHARKTAPAEPTAAAAGSAQAPPPSAASRPTLPLGLPRAAALIDEMGSRLISEHIAAKGVADSGAGRFYESIVERGGLVQSYDHAVASWILANTGADAEILEVGAGVGAFSLLLGLAGRRVVALDLDSRRIAMGRQIKESLAARLGGDLTWPKFVEATFPCSPSPVAHQRGVVVITNMVFGWDDDRQRAMLSEIARFGAAVIDADRFGVHRRTDAEREAFDHMVRGAGMELEPLDLVSDMRFVRLTPSGTGQTARAMTAELAANP